MDTENQKKAMPEAQRKSCRNFCQVWSSVKESARQSSHLMHILDGTRFNQVGLFKDRGVPTVTPEGSLEVLLKSHFPGLRVNVTTLSLDREINKSAKEAPGYIAPFMVKRAIDLL